MLIEISHFETVFYFGVLVLKYIPRECGHCVCHFSGHMLVNYLVANQYSSALYFLSSV